MICQGVRGIFLKKVCKNRSGVKLPFLHILYYVFSTLSILSDSLLLPIQTRRRPSFTTRFREAKTCKTASSVTRRRYQVRASATTCHVPEASQPHVRAQCSCDARRSRRPTQTRRLDDAIAPPRGSSSQTAPLNLQAPLHLLDCLYYTTFFVICQVFFTNLCIIFHFSHHRQPVATTGFSHTFCEAKSVVAPNVVRRYCSHADVYASCTHRQLPLTT